MILTVLAVTALGLTAGGVLAEAVVLVPYWQSLHPAGFLAWYRQYGGLLLRFYGPLEAVAALLVVAATVASWLGGGHATGRLVLASAATFVVLAMFPLYFQRVNASFADGSINVDDVAEELRRWARWHWVRVGLVTLAFVVTTTALLA